MVSKKQIKLDRKISEIIIVNNKKLAPYIEMVNASSRNIDQKHLGTILGIFEIKDTSKDSAYIVNFLASVVKKTYFNTRKKTVADSFEATLAKINLSLSELARHGNINWIGKIDAVICSISDNQINFSVSGDAKILLLRDQKLIEISSDLSPKDEATNPIKTFTDIASGRLEDNDKLILTTDDISHIFTLSDIENYALSFSNKKFSRFLKTALINELEIAGTIIVDVFKKTLFTQKSVKRGKSTSKKLNAFSSATFEKTSSEKKPKITIPTKSKPKEDNSSKNTSDKKLNSAKTVSSKKGDFVNKKTGHIYLKNNKEKFDSSQDNQFNNSLIIFQEKIFEFGSWLKNRYLDKGYYNVKRYFIPLLANAHKKIFPFIKNLLLKYFTNLWQSIMNFLLKKTTVSKKIIKNITIKKHQPSKPKEIIAKPQNKSTVIMSSSKTTTSSSGNLKIIEKISKKITTLSFSIGKILPHPNKLKLSFKKMTRQQKIYTIVAIMAILILPLVFTKLIIKNNPSEVSNQPSYKTNSNELSINPATEKYIEATQIYQSNDNLLGTFIFNGSVFAISKHKLIKLINNNQYDFPFPDYFGQATTYSFMSDLNLLFLLDENKKLISFSPISRKFKDNVISIPEDSEITSIGTYLTYIYLVDTKNNQIYRYPRAEGGFGEKTNWLKENIDLKNISAIAVDENIFLLNSKNNILKLTKGKLQPFNLKMDDNSSASAIFTNDDLSYIYILDNLNGEIVIFDKNGNRFNFLSNQKLTQANNFWIDEKKNLTYFTVSKTLFKLKYNFKNNK